MYKFAAASEYEPIVFGSTRPGYSNIQVQEWIEFMHNQDMQRICCLLTINQLNRYTDLLGAYRQSFGYEQVCWVPIADFDIFTPKVLFQQILPFLAAANQSNEKAVVHCSGGIGRTGQVLVAWLIAGRGFSTRSAIATVNKTGKNPYEAVIAAPFKGRNPWKVAAAINKLLDECSFAEISN
jgi:protein-tyrosine phosphatase